MEQTVLSFIKVEFEKSNNGLSSSKIYKAFSGLEKVQVDLLVKSLDRRGRIRAKFTQSGRFHIVGVTS